MWVRNKATEGPKAHKACNAWRYEDIEGAKARKVGNLSLHHDYVRLLNDKEITNDFADGFWDTHKKG